MTGVGLLGLLVFIVIFIGFFAGIVVLQVFLSRKTSKWPGLILPAVNIFFSLVIVVGMIVYTPVRVETGIIIAEHVMDIPYGQYYDSDLTEEMEARTAERLEMMEALEMQPVAGAYMGVFMFRSIFMLILFNIPTVILLLIYALCRGNYRKQRALEMMSVQDLG